MEELMNVDNLTEEEKNKILLVIKRDEDLRRAQDTRIGQLKTEIHNLRMQSILRDGDDLSKICARCHKPFGFFFNTGDICTQCKFRVCSVCRESLLSGKWLCVLCYKQVQLKGLTGEWIYGGTDNESHQKSWSGAEMVKKSLRKSLSANGNLSAKTREGDGGSGGTESKHGLIKNSSASHEELDRVGYPKDSDKKRLSSLFDSFKSNKDEAGKEKPGKVEENYHQVKRVSCRRRRDSDSESDSGSSMEGESPMEVVDSKTQLSDNVSSAHSLVLAQNLSETESTLDLPKAQRLSTEISEDVQVPNNVQDSKLVDANGGQPALSESPRRSQSPEVVPMTPTETVITVKRRSGEPEHMPVLPEAGESPMSPVRNASQMSDHRPNIVRRTSSEKSDSSMSSARTASPATKMRLLDLASKRALERESFDQEESGNESPKPKENSLTNGFNQTRGHRANGSSARHIRPQVTVTGDLMSDETESHGGDSGHISGTSADNTPEHRSRSPRHSHLSIPSLALTSTSAEEQASQEEEEEDIDKVVATHKSIGSLRGSYGNLNSSLALGSKLSSDSRESLYSVYSDAGEINYGRIPVTGEILFGVDYNYKTGALEIYIKQCKDIAPVDTKRNKSDPYVKTYLLPDRTRSGKRKTKIKKHTLNPTFDEVLRYVISKSEVENRALWVTVWHHDRFGRNDFLGEVMIGLDCYKFGDATPKWYPLQERLEAPGSAPVSYKGDLIVSVKYVPAENIESKDISKKGKSKKTKGSPTKGELQVLVKEARNLTAVRSNGASDPFCKAYLLPEKHKSSKQKTPVIKRNCNPTWNHVFLFEDVDLTELKDRSLELTLWDYDKITSNDFLGGVRLNLGTGVAGGRAAEWMDARGEEISIWQSMMDRPNCWNDATIGLRASMGKSEIRK